MYLKNVEIQGFKSFGDSVNLIIPPGITVVVGPNGCGKSNIADAMRWVLGEQSAKSLRGTKMEDVIFSGTQSRRGLGYAQVSMTLDNSEGKLRIDYSEVVITRRVYRSGESEYFLNKSPCRLRDIQELLMGTGVGKENYSIIGQGQIDEILSSKPEDRRNLFEEAAGIYKYKLRKIEAEKKLEKENENLVRVQDIITEIETRMVSLEKQAEQAKLYMGIQESLKIAELNVFLFEADKIEKDILGFKKSHGTLQSDFKSNNKELTQIKQEYDEIRKKLNEFQALSADIQTEIINIRMNIEKYEGSIKVIREKINAIDETILRLNNEHNKRDSKSIEQELEIQKLENKKIEIETQVLKEQEELNKLQKKHDEIISQIMKEEETLNRHKNDTYQTLAKLADIRASIEKGNTLTEQVGLRKNKIIETLQVIHTDKEHHSVRCEVLQKEKNQTQEIQNKTHQNIITLKENLSHLENEKQKLYTMQRGIEDNYHRATSRYKVLCQMKNEYEGFQKSVKNILQLKDKNPMQWQNIYGVVGELITVPKELEVAIDVALGGSIQHIVTKDEETAKKAIIYIKNNNLGRATFLPISSVKKSQVGSEANQILKENGVIGFGNNLIQYDNIYSNIISNLLGRVIIIDHMDHAIQLARKYNYRYRIVTLDGEVLNPGGSITGGSFYKNRESIFSRNREVVELSKLIDSNKTKLQNIEKQNVELTNQYSDLVEQLKSLENQRQTLELEQTERHIEINKVSEALKQIHQQQSNLEEEKLQLENDVQQMVLDMVSNKELLETTQAQLQEMAKEEKKLQTTIQNHQKQRDLVSDNITSHRVSLSSMEEVLHYTKEQIQRITKDIEHHVDENKAYENQLQDSSHRKENLEKEIKELMANIRNQENLLEQKNNSLTKTKEKEISYRNKEDEKRNKQNALVERNSLLQAEIYRIENKITKLTIEKENIFQKIWDDYEATYESAKKFKTDLGTINEMKKIANEYKGQIRKLGVINVGAVQEYEETKERYEFLRKHEQDILKAETTLRQLIEELTTSMEEIFAEQFEKISHNFNIVFTELFGGGQAFLQLTDTDNILESGIEIIAQPPGKKLQNMALLSGGERALTAIAILFGILRLKPSPFAILDEIEAALDDANVVRFSSYLKGLGNKMQFIVITHRKGTMEAADTMYGVTMEEQGVSKVVSVQLDEMEQYATEKAT